MTKSSQATTKKNTGCLIDIFYTINVSGSDPILGVLILMPDESAKKFLKYLKVSGYNITPVDNKNYKFLIDPQINSRRYILELLKNLEHYFFKSSEIERHLTNYLSGRTFESQFAELKGNSFCNSRVTVFDDPIYLRSVLTFRVEFAIS